MKVTSMAENFAPYAAPINIREILRHFRHANLPNPLSGARLEEIGIPRSSTGVTLRALAFLNLIDAKGNLTAVFNQLHKATEDEYRIALAEILRKAYVRVFTVVDPAVDDKIKISQGFLVYEPSSQHLKMIRLFIGLCEEAGIVIKRSVRDRGRRLTKAGYTKTVKLQNNLGTVTISVSINPIELTGGDRTWFFALIDKLNEYVSGS